MSNATSSHWISIRAELHYQIRQFLSFCEQVAREFGLTPQQYWLLQAIVGWPVDGEPTITAVAGRLCIRHHTAVELVDRAAEGGLVSRRKGQDDKRKIFVEVTPKAKLLLLEIEGVVKIQDVSALRDALSALSALV